MVLPRGHYPRVRLCTYVRVVAPVGAHPRRRDRRFVELNGRRFLGLESGDLVGEDAAGEMMGRHLDGPTLTALASDHQTEEFGQHLEQEEHTCLPPTLRSTRLYCI